MPNNTLLYCVDITNQDLLCNTCQALNPVVLIYSDGNMSSSNCTCSNSNLFETEAQSLNDLQQTSSTNTDLNIALLVLNSMFHLITFALILVLCFYVRNNKVGLK